jgi:uncharacterized protein (TIGR02001 family)
MALKLTQQAGRLCVTLPVALPLILLSATSAHARDGFGGSVAVTTDYLYRGLSQTRGEPALQGAVQWTSSAGWNVGLWASTVEFAPDLGPRFEVDLHAARSWALGSDWSVQVGWVHYAYPDDDGFDYDYDELTASLSFQQRLTLNIAWSPNTTQFGNHEIVREKQAVAYELTGMQPINSRLSLCAGAGYYDVSELFGVGYWYWNVGVTFMWDALQVDVMRIDTDATAEELYAYPASGGRWTAALSWRF